MIKFLKSLADIRQPKKQLIHIILVSFLGAFAVVHSFSVYVGGGIYIRGYHIHHFYFGMLFLTIGGLLGILSTGRRKLQIASSLLGIGMGLFADEVGLLLTCTTAYKKCDYAFPDSFDIAGTVVVFLILVLVIVSYTERPKKN